MRLNKTRRSRTNPPSGARLSPSLVLDCVEYLLIKKEKTKRLQRG